VRHGTWMFGYFYSLIKNPDRFQAGFHAKSL
jgi:hypothetical protein